MILTGYAGNLCILFTANDDYMRDFNLVVPADCVASNEPDENRSALEQMRKYLHADITESAWLDLAELRLRTRRKPGQHPQEEPQRHAA